MPDVKIKSIPSICKHITKLRIKVKILAKKSLDFDLLEKKFQDLEKKLSQIESRFPDSNKENICEISKNDSLSSPRLIKFNVEPLVEVGNDKIVSESPDFVTVNHETDYQDNSHLTENLLKSDQIQEKFEPNKVDKIPILSLKKISDSEIQKYLKKSQNSNVKQKIKEHKCCVCGKISKLRANLMTHMRIHTGEKPYSCSICQKSFGRSDHLKFHMISHSDKKFSCQVCRKDFRHSSSLEDHSKIHKYSKYLRPFECLICKKGFKQKRNLLAHSRLHNPDELFKCPKCPCVHTSRDGLKLHISNKHNDFRPFECLVCKKNFKRKDQLLVHSRLHNPDELFKCPKCSCAYTRRVYLKMHISNKHKDDPKVQIPPETRLEIKKKPRLGNDLQTCTICLAVFSKSSKLDEHLLTNHQN